MVTRRYPGTWSHAGFKQPNIQHERFARWYRATLTAMLTATLTAMLTATLTAMLTATLTAMV